jgi:RecA-family ATPase
MNARDYGRAIYDLATQRSLIVIAEDMANAAYDAPVDFPPNEQLAEHMRRLSALNESTSEPDSAALEFARDVDASAAAVDVIKHLLPAGAVAFLYGPSTAGKTFLTLDASFCVALEKEFLGKPTRRGAVLYVALEGSAKFGQRIRAAADLHGDPGNYFARLKSLVTLGRSPRAEADVARIIAAARLLAKQAGGHVALVVIDTLARALAGDNENEAAAISAVVSQANRIAAETGAAVLIVHHPGKDQERGMRGSYSLFADGDVVIRVDHEKGADVRTVVLEKAKDGEEGPIGAFALERVVLGQDADGDDITSCVVRPCAGETVGRQKPIKSKAAQKALNELHQLVL